MSTPEAKPIPLLVLVGPTGTGKTAVGIELCQLLNGEIVSADSMQIYRGCDIGTAKATPEEQARGRHHLIDIREPWEKYSAAEWARDAAATLADIAARGKQPIVVGGTGFYLRALLQPDLLPSVPPNPELRQELEQRAEREGAQALHDELQSIDPEAAARLHPNDVRRVIRALEVAAARQDVTPGEESSQTASYDARVFGLDLPREQLYQRLEQRIDHMIAQGFFEELRAILAKHLPADATVLQSLGYKEIIPALDDPAALAEAIAIWKRDTRRYVKRQLTWFRHQLPVQWINIEGLTPAAVARLIADEWKASLNQRL